MNLWRRIRGADNRTGHLLAWIGLGVLLIWLLPHALEWVGETVRRALPPPAQAPLIVPQPQVDESSVSSPEGEDEQATPVPQTTGEESVDDDEEEDDEDEETATPPPEETGPSPEASPPQ